MDILNCFRQQQIACGRFSLQFHSGRDYFSKNISASIIYPICTGYYLFKNAIHILKFFSDDDYFYCFISDIYFSRIK